MGKRLIIDCESLIYRACVATQELKEVEDGVYTQLYDTNKGIQYLKEQLDKFTEATSAEDYVFVLGSTQNYRKIINPKYKSNRTSQPHIMLKTMMQKTGEVFKTTYLPYLEADDTCRIIYEEDKFNNIIVSIDKDLRTFFCRLYNPDRPNEGIVNISNKVAQFNFFKQLIMGDSCDGYEGIKGYGEVKTKRWLLEKDRTLEDICDLYVENGYTIKDFNRVYDMAKILGVDSYNDGVIKLKASSFDTTSGKEF